MPITMVSSGPSFERNGVPVEPMAEHRTCETCGYEGAPFGRVDPITGRKTAWCGWQDGEPVCVGKGRAQDLFGEVA